MMGIGYPLDVVVRGAGLGSGLALPALAGPGAAPWHAAQPF
jgi:hypothetical protein